MTESVRAVLPSSLMAFFDQDVSREQARKAGLASIGAAAVAADGKDSAELNELNGCAEFFNKCPAVINAVPVATAARHVDLFGAVIFKAGQAHMVRNLLQVEAELNALGKTGTLERRDLHSLVDFSSLLIMLFA